MKLWDARRYWPVDFILLGAIWGSSFLFMRTAALEFGAMPTAFARVGIAAIFLLPLLLLQGHGAKLRQHWKLIFAVGVLNSGIPFTLYCFAVLAITTGLSAILNATVPLFGALIAWVWLKDRPTLWRLAGMVIGFGGVAMLAWDGAAFKAGDAPISPGMAVIFCLLACVCYGISAALARRYLGGLPSLVTATGSQCGATLALALPAAYYWPAQMPGADAWASVAMVGVMCTGIAYVLYFRLIENAGPARALSVTFVLPMFAVLYGAIFLGEPVTAWMLLCGAVIVLGTALSTGLLHPRRKKS